MSKIKEININNLAVFKNFFWKNTVKDKTGKTVELSDINIFYGRNYSGKTILSRIFRAYETGIISDKYENPDFSLKFEDKMVVTQKDISTKLNIRVFNEDFNQENLSFIYDPNKEIKSFAILGDENATLLKEIGEIENELNNTESGLNLQFEKLNDEIKKIENDESAKMKFLNTLMHDEVLDQKKGIKYNSDRFGDQNYNVTKLKDEILIVSDSSELTEQDKEKLICIINAKQKIDDFNEVYGKVIISMLGNNKEITELNKLKQLVVSQISKR